MAATGLGKTVMFAFLPERFPHLARQGMLVLVHRRELVEQAADKIKRAHPRRIVEIEMGARRAHPYADVVVASVQTLGRSGSARIRRFRDRFGILVIDEAHHVAPGSQYERVLSYFGVGPEARFDAADISGLPSGQSRLLVGVTATPNRHDGQGLHLFFDDIAKNLDIRWGIGEGYLVDIHATRIETGCDIAGVSSRAGDFAAGELEACVNTHERNEVVVKGFLEAAGRKAIAFCVGVRQAYELAETFRSYGVAARAVDGAMDAFERAEGIDAFRKGQVQVLTNCMIATEGFDVPDVDTILMARPTKSTPLYTQMIGRGTRPVVNPDAETAERRRQQIAGSSKPFMRVIDFTDNTGKHNIVTAPRLFGLERSFDTGGGSIVQAVETIEALEKEHPHRPLRKAKSLDEVQIIAETISVWDVAETPESLASVTSFHWIEVAEGSYQLHVPASLAEGLIAPQDRRDFVVRLEADRLGRYRATVVRPPLYVDGRRIAPREAVTSARLHTSKEDAIGAVDAFVVQAYPSLLPLLSRGQAWQERPASEKQVHYLRRLGVHIPEGYALSRGMASRLINAAKARQMATAPS